MSKQGLFNLSLAFLAVFFTLLAKIESVRADGVITDLTADKVPIEWNFTGANIFLFGAIEGEISPDNKPDVIVVVRGPSEDLVARKKQRVAGVWVNLGPKKVKEVPLYYSVASSRPYWILRRPLCLTGWALGLMPWLSGCRKRPI